MMTIAQPAFIRAVALPPDILDPQLLSPQQWALAEERHAAIKRLDALPKRTRSDVQKEAEQLGMSVPLLYRLMARHGKTGSVTSLLPSAPCGGRGKLRLTNEVEDLIIQCRREKDRDAPNSSTADIVADVRSRCLARGLPKPSPSTVRSRLLSVPIRERSRARVGMKRTRELYDPALGETPPMEHPLGRVQIDHTLCDVVLASKYDRLYVGRPWITMALDEHSRAVLSFVLSWEYPSATTVALALTRAVLPKTDWAKKIGLVPEWPMYGRPDQTFTDNAKEFQSEALKLGCKAWGMQPPELRPLGRPHYGGIIERVIGTTMRAMRILPGHTAEILRRRQEDQKPEAKAEMTIEEFELWLAEFIAGRYHHKEHDHFKRKRLPYRTPHDAWTKGLLGTEKRPGRGRPEPISNPERFFIDFLPLEKRTIQRYGLQWSHITYWDDALRLFLDRGDQRHFLVRRNTLDLTAIWLLRPEDGSYLRLPAVHHLARGVQLWEVKAAVARLRAETGGAEARRIDEENVLRSIARQRDMLMDAKLEGKRARNRRNRERLDDTPRMVAGLGHEPVAAPAPTRPDPTDSANDDELFTPFTGRLVA